MEMEIISREIIKPCSPTPPHLRIYPFSFIDNLHAPNAIPLLYFYHHPNPNDPEIETKISILKKSLSKVLSIYYPLAGRINDDNSISIDCNDQGVSLLATRFKSIKLSETLHNPNEAFLNSLFPDQLHWQNLGSSLVAIQINTFACGGIAISLCLSHKVGDLSSLANFVNDWASLSSHITTLQENGGELPLPLPLPVIYGNERDSPFPQGNLPVLTEFKLGKQDGVVCRRLVFEASKIESLKAIAEVESPTRVQLVLALIYKCAISAWGGHAPPLCMIINLRTRMDPPLPDKSLANLVWFFHVSNERVEELKDLVRNIRTSLCEFCDKCKENFGDSSLVYKFLLNQTTQATTRAKKKKEEGVSKQNIFLVSSWCRYETYKADFGWGKPIWVTSSGSPVRNNIILMDTIDGRGIEAIVNMEEQDMALFLQHELLLQFASLDPNRWI